MIITHTIRQKHNIIKKARSPPAFRWNYISKINSKGKRGNTMIDYKQEVDIYFELKGTPDSTKESYILRINAFVQYMQDRKKGIEEITGEDIRQYILYLKREKRLSAGTINNYISAIKFFYTYVLGKEWNSKKIPRMKMRTKFAVIPPKQDIQAILDEATNLKHKAILVLIYGSGLRVGEVAKLKISDICSKTMRVRVDQAKHDTNRYTILSEIALEVLRKYFREYFSTTGYKPDDWLFPGQDRSEHIHVKTIKNTLIKLRNRLHLGNNISAHTLRHCFAAHSLEYGTDPVYIQQMLGHKRLQTTLTYLHMTSKSLMGVKSPLDTGRIK